MIELKKLNGTPIFINPDLIRLIESTPDTLVNFLDGESILVLNSPQEIISSIISFRKKYSFFAPNLSAIYSALQSDNEDLQE